MPITITNHEARPRVFGIGRGKGARRSVTLLPGDNVIEDEEWSAMKETKWNIHGKAVSAVDALVEEGILEVGKKVKGGGASEADSIATSGAIPASRMGGLPGEGGEDITRRTSAEDADAKERAKNEKRK